MERCRISINQVNNTYLKMIETAAETVDAWRVAGRLKFTYFKALLLDWKIK